MTVFVRAREFTDDLPFERAKGRLAVGLENIRDGAARARLNQLVRVEIIEMQLVGHEPADGGLARAHETDEREIDDAAVALHGDGVNASLARCTPIIAQCWRQFLSPGRLLQAGGSPTDTSARHVR